MRPALLGLLGAAACDAIRCPTVQVAAGAKRTCTTCIATKTSTTYIAMKTNATYMYGASVHLRTHAPTHPRICAGGLKVSKQASFGLGVWIVQWSSAATRWSKSVRFMRPVRGVRIALENVPDAPRWHEVCAEHAESEAGKSKEEQQRNPETCEHRSIQWVAGLSLRSNDFSISASRRQASSSGRETTLRASRSNILLL